MATYIIVMKYTTDGWDEEPHEEIKELIEMELDTNARRANVLSITNVPDDEEEDE